VARPLVEGCQRCCYRPQATSLVRSWPFAWKVVREHDGYTYFENAITGRRRCYWTGSVKGHIDNRFMRSGARTKEGKARISASRTKHGRYSQQAIQQRREMREALRLIRECLRECR
jgi:hypothetical protein